MITRQCIIDEALSWEDTPYHHLQRCKGAGVDCIQFVVGVALNCGLLTEAQINRIPYYTDQWHLHKNEELLLNTIRTFDVCEVPIETRQPGDILIFQYGRVCNHVSIFLPNNELIHATGNGVRKVTRHSFDLSLQKRLRHCFLMPGITP